MSTQQDRAVLAVSALKGGSGKTTVAVALAEAAADDNEGRVLLVDADPQGSALDWAAMAEMNEAPMGAEVVGMAVGDISRRLKREAADLVVIDAPPGDRPIVEAVSASATMLIITLKPTPADLRRAQAALNLAAERGVRAVCVLSLVDGRTKDGQIAREVLTEWGGRVLETELALRASIARNYGWPPAGPLAEFGQELLTELVSIATERRA